MVGEGEKRSQTVYTVDHKERTDKTGPQGVKAGLYWQKVSRRGRKKSTQIGTGKDRPVKKKPLRSTKKEVRSEKRVCLGNQTEIPNYNWERKVKNRQESSPTGR